MMMYVNLKADLNTYLREFNGACVIQVLMLIKLCLNPQMNEVDLNKYLRKFNGACVI